MTPAPAVKPAPTPETGAAGWLPTRNQFFFILFAYFAIQLLTRSLISETIGIDEADQVVLGQKWSWGYGPQPPLYTWLLRLFFGAFGSSVFSLTLLRELLLLGIYVLAYFNGRALAGSHAAGIATAVALQFNPSISWESQRELTHSIVASMMLLGAVLAFLRLQPAHSGAYVVLGICGGLSMLSKYNAALFYAALLIAAISVPSLRPRVLHWRMAMAVLISLLFLAPNLRWVSMHRDLAYSSMYKFGIHADVPWSQAVRAGLVQWIAKSAAHVAPTILVFVAIFWRPLFTQRALNCGSDQQNLLARTFGLIVLMAVMSILLFKVTSFKDRWLQPLFVGLPLLFAPCLSRYLDKSRLRAILLLGAFIGGIVTVLAPGRMLATESLKKHEVLNAPFRKLAPDLAGLIRQSDFIVADNRWLAGNLRLWFQQKLALTPELIPYYPCTGQTCLLIWETGKTDRPPENLLKFAQQFTGKETVPPPLLIEETWKYHHSKKMRLNAVLVEKTK